MTVGRLIPGWIHPQAARDGAGLVMRVAARPIVRVPMGRFAALVHGVPLTGGQAQTTVAGGTATVSVGPQGRGTTWYPSSVTISTTTGAADASTAQVFMGAQGVASLMVGQSYAGGGDTVSIAVASMQPGDLLIVKWSGAHNGDTATANVTGSQDVLAY